MLITEAKDKKLKGALYINEWGMEEKNATKKKNMQIQHFVTQYAYMGLMEKNKI